MTNGNGGATEKSLRTLFPALCACAITSRVAQQRMVIGFAGVVACAL